MRMAREYFGDMPPSKVPERFREYEPFNEDLPTFDTIKTVIQERPGIHQAHIAIGFPLKIVPKDIPAFELIADILDSRLFEKLREENQDFDGGVYNAPVSFEYSKLHSIFIVRTAINSSYVESATEKIVVEFQKIRNELVDDPFFNASVEALLSDYRIAFEQSGEMLCDMITNAFVNDDEELRSLHNYPKALKRLNPKKLMLLANQYINPQKSVRVIIKPAS